jgi:trk system potassium uptake protein TrkH
MNIRLILKNLGIVLMVEAACMLPSLFVSVIYGQSDLPAFIISILILLTAGLALYSIKQTNGNLHARDGFAIVALSWFSVSAMGALPFIISGSIPSYIDAFFETVSGFTTTGASILRQVEALPKGLIFWRSFTHWMGGMGVLVLTLAVLPKTGATTFNILKAESPGPIKGKLVPKIGQTAKILYAIYIVFTVVQIVLLIIAGMPVYDSFIHTFGTAGTGGFSSKNLSIGAYNNVYVEIIITVFMLIFGINFSLYYQALKGNLRSFLRDEEFRFYLGTVLTATAIITINVSGSVYQTLGEGLRHASFQVGSIITTTGYSTADFNLWPSLSKFILVALMFIGASAGSTGGAIKCIRIVILFKVIKREIVKSIHPKSVHTVKIGGKVVEERTLSGVLAFFFTYMAIYIASVLIVSLDGMDMTSTATAVAATLGNIGPGLETVGPMGNFSDFSVLSKAVMSVDMLVGRLEILPMLLIFTPSFWKRVNI